MCKVTDYSEAVAGTMSSLFYAGGFQSVVFFFIMCLVTLLALCRVKFSLERKSVLILSSFIMCALIRMVGWIVMAMKS